MRNNPSEKTVKSPEWASLEEGWRLFERDLGKLQGFIEINATGFRKILKKWDKRSKSNTKELYLERQVEVQPCFNREFIAKLSDIVAANLLDMETDPDQIAELFADLPLPNEESFDRDDYDTQAGEAVTNDALLDAEANLPNVIEAGRDALAKWIKQMYKIRAKRNPKSHDRAMRILWRAAFSVPDDYLDLVFAQPLDYKYVDIINNRDPMHQGCIVGSLKVVELCIQNAPELMEIGDAYNRTPLHYAAMNGHPSIVQLLLDNGADANKTDMDGYTPLMHAITQGHLEVIRIFVGRDIDVEPTKMSSDLIPLSLACQYGHVEVARLLLKRGATIRPNSEGLYPMHFAAKAGHADICRLLVEEGGPDGGGKDMEDKYNQWTPLHHAAVGGRPQHIECIKILVEAGCNVNALDEYGKSPGWYAAWFGQVEILKYLIAAGAKLGMDPTHMENLGLAADPQMDALSPGSDLDLDAPPNDDFEIIPSLSLPPPIMPLRVYGHEFLAKRCLVQVSLGHPFTHGREKTPPIKLYSRSGEDSSSLHLWSSLKLVMASRTDTSVVPHSVILPLADSREVFSFQVQSLERFSLELSLYPTFGSKVIGRAIIHPETFSHIQNRKCFTAYLVDHHLKTIGEVAFEISCIKPFEGAQLEIGGRVETYWKSKVTPSNPTQDHAHQFQSHRPVDVSSMSPAVRPNTISVPSQQESALLTASSLSGDYIRLDVQVTRDGVPVIYADAALPVPGLDVGVSNVTYAQFQALAKAHGRELGPDRPASPAEWFKLVSRCMTSLESLLQAIPADVGTNLCLRFVRQFDAQRLGIAPSMEVNEFVDQVLQVVYSAGQDTPGRRLLFTSFDPTVCTALNWKQPNYAVIFASYCGLDRNHKLAPADQGEENDTRCLSVREAVNFAKTTNLLGVMLEATTLAAVPSLVASVKDAGLLLATFGNEDDINHLRLGASDGRTVDAFSSHGIMKLVI